MRRVVVTGIGAVTPLGNNFRDSWQAVRKGRSGVRRLDRPDLSFLPWKAAGEVKMFEPSRYLDDRDAGRLDPFVQFAVAAAVMSFHDAGLSETTAGPDFPEVSDPYIASGGVLIGSSRGGISTLEKTFTTLRERGGKAVSRRRVSPYLMPSSTVGTASSFAAGKLAVRGYCLGISNACASGTNAIGEAFRMIRAGFEGPLIAGGAEAPICLTGLEGYGCMGALSVRPDSTASRPFDKTRDGFVLSEGACVLVLEDMDKARGRGARIYGEVVGYANTVDALHLTRPDRRGEADAIRSALADTGIPARYIDYISTHGTSTQIGDRIEAGAIADVFGNPVPASAIKSMTGHMLAASGAFEIACALMSMKENIIPPTINLGERDDNCRIGISSEKREMSIGYAISNTFGFGGVNAVLVMKNCT